MDTPRSIGREEKVVREVKRQTRRKFSAAEKIRIVLDGLKGDVTLAELENRNLKERILD